MRAIFLLPDCFLSLAPTARCERFDSTPTAHIRNGTIIGRYLPSFHQDLFLGAPFANAPRLANPTPSTRAWHFPLPATSYGPTCYGSGSNNLFNLTQSEECLNLNIIRPAGCSADAKLPVLLWLYGGGYRQGATADPMWNLSYVVQTSADNRQPIIAVSANYRLSFLGFPGGKESQAAGITNLGLKDHRMALQWLQEKVAAFGGDPDKQLIAYGGKGGEELFRGAKMAGYDKIVASANSTGAVDTLACLRAAPLEAIYSVEDTTGPAWAPIIDGDFIRQRPAAELAAGNVAHVPILLGSNFDEGLLVVNTLGFSPNLTAALTPLLANLFPAIKSAVVDAILTAYPEGGPEPPYSLSPDYPWCAALAAANLSCDAEYRRTAAILGDYFSDAPRRYMAGEWARLGLPAYSFRFDTDPTAIPIVYWNGLGPGFALHGAELAYEFGLPGGVTGINFTQPSRTSRRTGICRTLWSATETVARVRVEDMLITDLNLDSSIAPYSPPYGQFASNMVFNATENALKIHVEPDTYREEGIHIWNENIDAV